MLYALRYYATGADYRTIGDAQGVSKSTICRCVLEFTDFLYDNARRWIRFPVTRAQLRASTDGFYEKYRMPLVCGTVDCFHCEIQRPGLHEEAYVNRHGWHSINSLVSQKLVIIKMSLNTTTVLLN